MKRICHDMYVSVSISTASARVCVCVCGLFTPVCEAHRELCSFGYGCMMDIWKLNWLMVPPSQQATACPIAELRGCVCIRMCACVYVCVCVTGRYPGGSEWTLHLDSCLATDKHTPAGHSGGFPIQMSFQLSALFLASTPKFRCSHSELTTKQESSSTKSTPPTATHPMANKTQL